MTRKNHQSAEHQVLSTEYQVHRERLRAAHSLIELLVVLIIVGVLIAIIVPAVQRSREAARMAQCIHNQGQLAKAVHLHLADEPYGRFPGYRAFAADGTTVIGWAPQVFEYLGRSDLPDDPAQATFIEVLTCPSDQGPTDTPRLNYVVNGGQADTDTPADGIFFDHAKQSRVYITKDDFLDGLTNTILLAENLDATHWNVTDEANQCILWPLVAGNEVNNGAGARPSSHHPGGFVTAFADGSVKFMSETDFNNDSNLGTPDSYYVALLTPGGNDAEGVATPGTDPPDEGDQGTPCDWGPYVCGVLGEYWNGYLNPMTEDPDATRVEQDLQWPYGNYVEGFNWPPGADPVSSAGEVRNAFQTMVFTGQLVADETATYQFWFEWDDQAIVSVDGNELLSVTSPFSWTIVPQAKGDPVQLEAGTWVDFHVWNSDGGWRSRVRVMWEKVGSGTGPVDIPSSNLRTLP